MNYSRFISKISAARLPSPIRELNRPFPPEMILLTAGKPNPGLFPIVKATFETADGSTFTIGGERMKEALQYLPTQGMPELAKWLKGLQDHIHRPPFRGETDLLVTCGSQDGLSKAIEMSMEQGSPVVLEEFVYPGTLAAMDPYQPNYIKVRSDGSGMDPGSLQEALEQWSMSAAGTSADTGRNLVPKPKLLYINPTGGNPTGTVLPLQRRHRIYELARQYDLLILEDDPYYYVQFGEDHGRVPSFYSMDVDGRVMRFDSFSKVLSSGLRLGFVTGPKPLINRVMLHMQSSVMHTASLSQFVAYDVLNRWGIEGFLDHVSKVETFYRQRRDLMVSSAEKHLKGLCEWSVPGGGMFLWMKVHGVEDTWDMMMQTAMSKNVLLIPGRAFVPGGGNSSYLRASFSLVEAEKLDPAFERLAQVIRDTLAKSKQ